MDLKCYYSISEIPAQAWAPLQDANFPFLDYAFLQALEESQVVGTEAGWQPLYLTLWEEGVLCGALCLYKKNNSYGEFIFDWEWARAYEAHGLAYYPKLVAAVPFTPATGAKLLLNPKLKDSNTVRKILIGAALEKMQQLDCSGLHFLFIPYKEIPAFESANFLIRHSYQFHWENPGYHRFEDFLETLKRKRRQQIVKERKSLRERGFEIVLLQAEKIESEHMQFIFACYLNTIRKNRSVAYLNQKFFEKIYQKQQKNLLLILAQYQGRWVAGSINFFKGKNLYGRYWGCLEEHDYLHFELCYYQNIEYAIKHQLTHFEAGAQGTHKMLRGLSPTLTYSAHYLRNPIFSQAIGDFIEREKCGLEQGMQEALNHDAYKR